MSINFFQGMNLHAQAANEAFGEQMTVLPMKVAPNRSPLRDTTRESFQITGQYIAEPFAGLDYEPGHGKREPHVSSRAPWAVFAKCDLPYGLQQGDLIRRDCTGELFEVKESLPHTVSQIRYRLFQMGVNNHLD